MFVHSSVVDDTDHDRITAGSLVTLSVTLYRTSLFEHCGISVDELIEEASADHNKEETLPQPDPEDEVDCRCTIRIVWWSSQHPLA